MHQVVVYDDRTLRPVKKFNDRASARAWARRRAEKTGRGAFVVAPKKPQKVAPKKKRRR